MVCCAPAGLSPFCLSPPLVYLVRSFVSQDLFLSQRTKEKLRVIHVVHVEAASHRSAVRAATRKGDCGTHEQAEWYYTGVCAPQRRATNGVEGVNGSRHVALDAGT